MRRFASAAVILRALYVLRARLCERFSDGVAKPRDARIDLGDS